MKRFWHEAAVIAAEGGDWQVALDGRPVRTQGGSAQIVPSRMLAQDLAAEWQAQGDEVDPGAFPLRDLADLAIDHIRAAPAAQADALLRYGETDTLLYRADPDEPLYRRQIEEWEPLVQAAEARHAITFERTSGIIHRPQPPATIAALREVLGRADEFTLAAVATLAPLAASLIVALAAIETDAEPDALFAAANLEEDWQTELWGADAEATRVRQLRQQAFAAAARFARIS